MKDGPMVMATFGGQHPDLSTAPSTSTSSVYGDFQLEHHQHQQHHHQDVGGTAHPLHHQLAHHHQMMPSSMSSSITHHQHQILPPAPPATSTTSSTATPVISLIKLKNLNFLSQPKFRNLPLLNSSSVHSEGFFLFFSIFLNCFCVLTLF